MLKACSDIDCVGKSVQSDGWICQRKQNIKLTAFLNVSTKLEKGNVVPYARPEYKEVPPHLRVVLCGLLRAFLVILGFCLCQHKAWVGVLCVLYWPPLHILTECTAQIHGYFCPSLDMWFYRSLWFTLKLLILALMYFKLFAYSFKKNQSDCPLLAAYFIVMTILVITSPWRVQFCSCDLYFKYYYY